MRTVRSIGLPLAIWLFTFSATAQGQTILDASCKLTLANTEVTVFINQALGRYVYVSRCDSLEGEFDNGTHQGVPTPYLVVLTIKQCNIQSPYFPNGQDPEQGIVDFQTSTSLQDERNQVYLTKLNRVLRSTDYIVDFTCERTTGTVNVEMGITVTPASDISLNTSTVPSLVFMKLTDGSSDNTGPPLSSAPVGSAARLHIWTNDVYTVNPTTGIDLRAAKIWVDGGTSSVTLIGVDGAGTYPGCKTQSWCCEVVQVAPGYLRMDFQIFLFSPGAPNYSQTFSATVDQCVGAACSPYDCTLNTAGGSASQHGRRRRDISTDVITSQVHISTSVKVTIDSETNVTTYETSTNRSGHDNKGENAETLKCDECPEEAATHAILGSLAAAIFVVMVANGFLYLWSRGACARKSRDLEEVEKDSQSEQSENDVAISENSNQDESVAITA